MWLWGQVGALEHGCPPHSSQVGPTEPPACESTGRLRQSQGRASHVPVQLPDGPEPADVAAAARQDRQVVGVQGEEEAFRGELRLRKRRLISI